MRSRHTTQAGDVPFTLERSGKRWKVRFNWKGKRIQESTGFSDLATARAWAHRRIDQEVRAASSPNSLGLESAALACLQARYAGERIKTKAFMNERHRLNLFAGFCPNLNLSDFEAVCAAVRSFFASRRGSPVTLDNERRVIHRLFSWLQETHQVRYPENPAGRKLLALPRAKRGPRPPAAEADLHQILNAARGQRIYPVLVLMCSGFRAIGVTRVAWEDIDWQAKTIRTMEKSLERRIPLSEWAVEELRGCQGRGPIWPFGIDNAHRDLAAIRARLGLSGPTFGGFRRFVLTRLYQAGVPPQKAAKIMGNSVQVALKHYVDLENLNAHDAAEVLGLNKVVQNMVQSKKGEKSSM